MPRKTLKIVQWHIDLLPGNNCAFYDIPGKKSYIWISHEPCDLLLDLMHPNGKWKMITKKYKSTKNKAVAWGNGYGVLELPLSAHNSTYSYIMSYDMGFHNIHEDVNIFAQQRVKELNMSGKLLITINDFKCSFTKTPKTETRSCVMLGLMFTPLSIPEMDLGTGISNCFVWAS